MDELRQLDEVAYVRFASVYRQFEDVEAFHEEIQRLRSQRSRDGKRGAKREPGRDNRDQLPLLPVESAGKSGDAAVVPPGATSPASGDVADSQPATEHPVATETK